MKNLFQTVTAATLVAVLFSCGGSAENKNTSDSANHHHDSMPKAADTAVIKTGQSVFFENIKEGQTFSAGEITVKFGLEGMTAEPAKNGVNADKGHHHLLVDTMAFIPAGEMIMKVPDRILHFGDGQVETKIKLAKGKHKLAIQFANGNHISYGHRMSTVVEINVK